MTRQRTGKLILTLEKSNFGPSDQAMEFMWDDQAQLFVGRLVGGGSAVTKANRNYDEQMAIVAALKACAAKGDTAPAAPRASRNALNVLAAYKEFPDALRKISPKTRKRFWAHIEVLRASNLVIERVVTKANRHKVDVLEAV